MEMNHSKEEQNSKDPTVNQEKARIMGSNVMLTMGKSQEGERVMDLLSARGITYAPFTMNGVQRPRVTSGGLELEGYDEISEHLDEIELAAEEE